MVAGLAVTEVGGPVALAISEMWNILEELL
jgi:hypothetical protein